MDHGIIKRLGGVTILLIPFIGWALSLMAFRAIPLVLITSGENIGLAMSPFVDVLIDCIFALSGAAVVCHMLIHFLSPARHLKNDDTLVDPNATARKAG